MSRILFIGGPKDGTWENHGENPPPVFEAYYPPKPDQDMGGELVAKKAVYQLQQVRENDKQFSYYVCMGVTAFERLLLGYVPGYHDQTGVFLEGITEDGRRVVGCEASKEAMLEAEFCIKKSGKLPRVTLVFTRQV